MGVAGSKRKSGRRAISPVIATIILIAITIVIAIAVAGWVFGLFGSYSKTQSATILAAESSCSTSGGCTIYVQNQGATTITVVGASINGQSASITGTTLITAGASGAVPITLPSTTTLTAGSTVEVELALSNGATLSTTLTVS
ncbi:MAG: archaellin/type IV pilin N-terminal domain-containing protein [Thermoprotei archaeon]